MRENIVNVVGVKKSAAEKPSELSSSYLSLCPRRGIKKHKSSSTLRFRPATRFLANPWRMKPVFACWWRRSILTCTRFGPRTSIRSIWKEGFMYTILSPTDGRSDATFTAPHFLMCHFSNRSFVVGIRCATCRRVEFCKLRELSSNIEVLKNYSFQRRSGTPRNTSWFIMTFNAILLRIYWIIIGYTKQLLDNTRLLRFYWKFPISIVFWNIFIR